MENPEKWNSEEKRLERKERLNGLKSKDGSKKPIKKSGKFMRIFLPIIAVILVLAVGVWAAIQFAVPQKIFAPMKINGKNVSSVEFSYYYANVLSNLSIDKTKDEGKAKLKQACTEDGYTKMTWQEYAYDLTAKQIVEIQIQYDLSQKAGMKLTDEEKQSVKDIFSSLIEEVGDEAAADNYLIGMFGKNVTIKTLTPIFEKATLANNYAKKAVADTAVTDDEIKAEYTANANTYDTVTFRLAYFENQTKDSATDAETKAFDAASKAKADAFLKNATDEATFKKLADEKTAADEKAAYAAKTAEEKKTADTEKATAEKKKQTLLATMTAEEKAAYESATANQDSTILYGMKKSDIESASADMSAWLFDAARKAGDKKAFSSSGSGYYAIYFVSRNTKYTLPTVRHILVSPNPKTDTSSGATYTAAEWTAARKEAETLLTKCTSLDAFIALVKDNTDDTATAATGGLYENVQRGKMVPQFNDWCFDSSRKAGDKAIVRTDYGFHIIYFVGMTESTSLSQNSATIKSTLADGKYKKDLESKKGLAEYKYTISDFGVSLMGL